MTQQKQTENQRPEFLTRPMRLRTIRRTWETEKPAVMQDKMLYSHPQNPFTDEPILDQLCLNPTYFTRVSGTSAHSLDSMYCLNNPSYEEYNSQGQGGAIEWDLFFWMFSSEIILHDELWKAGDA
jgi:hypothetical protein|tara:strand:- start:985 stop:1359 length:375 start_codon:yes stop_codon:yes gene_type:complete